jgi:hypothetical protein
VLPFSSIDCTALTRALGPVTEDVYGRAMARVLAHELYHVLTQTTDHSRTGIAKTCFTTGDLLSSRLDFENNILAQLRRLHRAPAQVVDADDDATGRQPF